MRTFRGRKVAALAAAVAALTISACGSDDSDSSSTSSASTPAASGPTAAVAPIGPAFKIGFICSCSGVQAAQTKAMGDVYKAWAESVNAKGGVNGHPVEVTVKDDAGDPAKAAQVAKELVEQTKVQAIVDTSLADAAFAPYLVKAGVPVIGGLSVSLPFLTNPTFFPSGSNYPITTVGVLQAAKDQGKKKLGLAYCAESPICKQLTPLAEGAAKLTGMTVASTGISSSASSYAAPCAKLKGDGADALFVASNHVIVERMVASCNQQGYKPALASSTNVADAAWLKIPAFEGVQLSAANALNDGNDPATKEMNDNVAKYAGGSEDGSQFLNMYSWSAGKLFEAAVAAGDLTPTSTHADIIDAMYKIKPGETLGGLAPPLTFTKGKAATPECYFALHVEGGKFVADNGNKPVCVPSAQAQGFTKAIQDALAKAAG